MPRKPPRWEYSHYRATLRHNGDFFAFVTADAIGNNIGAKDGDILMRALRSEQELEACHKELARLTDSPEGRSWKQMLEKLTRPATAETKEVLNLARAALAALNVGDIKTGSLLHLKLREAMRAYQASAKKP